MGCGTVALLIRKLTEKARMRLRLFQTLIWGLWVFPPQPTDQFILLCLIDPLQMNHPSTLNIHYACP